MGSNPVKNRFLVDKNVRERSNQNVNYSRHFFCLFLNISQWGVDLNPNIFKGFFTASAPRPIQSRSCDVHIKRCNNIVSSVDDQNQENWRLLVQERVASIGNKIIKKKLFNSFIDFVVIKLFLGGCRVFPNQPTVHRWGVCRQN